MASNNNYIQYVFHALDDREKLEALAEEASELSQAALKLIRAKGESKNWTPKTEVEAFNEMCEEALDVASVLLLLAKLPAYQEVHDYHKWKRWAERLGYEDNTTNE